MKIETYVCLAFVLSALCIHAVAGDLQPEGTRPLTVEGDFASLMVDGVDRFLLQQIDKTKQERSRFWNRDFSSAEAYNESIRLNRERLAKILGVRDERMEFIAPEIVATVGDDGTVAGGNGYKVYAVRWPVLADPAERTHHLASIHGEGLLLVPEGPSAGNVIAVPDAGQSPEQICGLADGIPPESQFARRAAESGFRVIVPTLISRDRSKRRGRADLTNREYLYRSAFELGRHVIGYEVQKILSAVDWFQREDEAAAVGVIGYGEGGLLTLYAGALDPRIQTVCVSGAIGPRENSWQEPIDRNVFGINREFGCAELAAMVLPRKLIAEFSKWPEADLPGNGGAPGKIVTPDSQVASAELELAASVGAQLMNSGVNAHGVTSVFGDPVLFGSALKDFLASVSNDRVSTSHVSRTAKSSGQTDLPDRSAQIETRQTRQCEEMDRHNQSLLRESPQVRKQYFGRLDTSSMEAFEKTIEPYRDSFRNDVVGAFDEPLLPFNARSRRTWTEDEWTGHEVMLDVFPDVFAYGILLIPKDLKPGERRPVVVCQHGLEGRPTHAFLENHRAYHDFAAELCKRGFITFCPQNPYIFKDRFRTLQRKANPLGKTLFSVIVPQHQQIVNWLKSQSFVDGERIAFYGLSYGGKSAMRIPALVTDYCLSICSADFGEWVRKNASSRLDFSYVWYSEYEIFEWDLGSTFNYAEMAALICPRPFMVERGHFDGVSEDEWVGYEYAKVRNLYAARLGLGDKTEIEWFVGPHSINGKGTFEFLHKHLNWPKPGDR